MEIPSQITVEIGLAEGVAVGVDLVNDRLVISPLSPRYDLSNLLFGMAPDLIRDAFDWGSEMDF